MHTTTIALILAAGLASAAPAANIVARQAPKFAPTQQTKGFNLIVNVTDPSTDFSPSINDYIISSSHSGAGSAFAVAVPPARGGRLFYVNSTDTRYGPETVLTDGGQPTFPSSWIVQGEDESLPNNPTHHNVFINAGSRGSNLGLAGFPAPVPALTSTAQGTYAICNSTLLAGVPEFKVVFAYTTYTSDPFQTFKNIPEGCAEVKLLPQCAQLNELPPNSISSHEYAATENCYADVASIDWTVYSA